MSLNQRNVQCRKILPHDPRNHFSYWNLALGRLSKQTKLGTIAEKLYNILAICFNSSFCNIICRTSIWIMESHMNSQQIGGHGKLCLITAGILRTTLTICVNGGKNPYPDQYAYSVLYWASFDWGQRPDRGLTSTSLWLDVGLRFRNTLVSTRIYLKSQPRKAVSKSRRDCYSRDATVIDRDTL